MDVFLTKYEYESRGVLHKKLEKNDMKAQCFCEDGRFFDKIWAWEQGVFLENGRFFDKIGVREQWFFRAKSEKKGDPIDFFGP